MKTHPKHLAVLSILLLLASLFLQVDANAAKAKPKVQQVSEDGKPDRIVLGWTADPATTQAVTWRTEHKLEDPQAQVAPMDADPKFESKAATVKAQTQAVDIGDKIVHHHTANFEGLSPDADYSYRVGDGHAWSEWNVFHTASDKPAPFRFIYLGDVQTAASLWSRTVRTAFREAPDARFILYAGDIINDGFNDRQWEEWSYALGFISRLVPSLASPGNHDVHRSLKAPGRERMASVSDIWRGEFALPLNGPKGIDFLAEEAYYVDYQGARIVSLDSNLLENGRSADPKTAKAQEAELAWLDETLQGADSRWTIVVHHHPIYSVGSQRDNEELRALLMPIYDKHHVDLVLQGHDHYYGRTWKIREGKIVSPEEHGTIYAVSMSGAKMYKKNAKFEPLMAVMRGDTQMFQVIEVDGARLLYEAYSVAAERVDAFELHKEPGKATEYVPLNADQDTSKK